MFVSSRSGIRTDWGVRLLIGTRQGAQVVEMRAAPNRVCAVYERLLMAFARRAGSSLPRCVHLHTISTTGSTAAQQKPEDVPPLHVWLLQARTTGFLSGIEEPAAAINIALHV